MNLLNHGKDTLMIVSCSGIVHRETLMTYTANSKIDKERTRTEIDIVLSEGGWGKFAFDSIHLVPLCFDHLPRKWQSKPKPTEIDWKIDR